MISVSTFTEHIFTYQGIFGLSLNGWILMIVMLSLSGAAFFIYFGAKKSGQFEDVEGIKYRMLIEDDEEWETFD